MFHLKPERLDVGEFNEQHVSICGKALVADSSGALYWPGEKALIVADLLPPASSGVTVGAGGSPRYNVSDALSRLAAAIDRTQAQTVVVLGAGRLDLNGETGMEAADAETLGMLQENREWIWISSDPGSEHNPRLGGHVFPALTVEGITLRHHPTRAGVTHEISGFLHPAAILSMNGHRLERRCFVGNGLRLVLPAYGTISGGLNILDDRFETLFSNRPRTVWMLGQEGLYPVAPRLLLED
jgi:uncharacterized protein